MIAVCPSFFQISAAATIGQKRGAFWGCDSTVEASFFVAADALRRLQPGAGQGEAGLLRAFDANRELICTTAARLYSRGSRPFYELIASDFVHPGR